MPGVALHPLAEDLLLGQQQLAVPLVEGPQPRPEQGAVVLQELGHQQMHRPARQGQEGELPIKRNMVGRYSTYARAC